MSAFSMQSSIFVYELWTNPAKGSLMLKLVLGIWNVGVGLKTYLSFRVLCYL